MTRRARIALFVFGVLLLIGSLAIFVYAIQSPETFTLQSTLQPTLLVPP
jgi:hypothetical protein